jgi:ribosomal protein L28
LRAVKRTLDVGVEHDGENKFKKKRRSHINMHSKEIIWLERGEKTSVS